MVIATTLGSGLAGLAHSRPMLSWGSGAALGKLPRVKLLAPDERPFLLLTPPVLGARFAMPSHMPTPPSIHIENGPRLVILTPDIRMTHDRRGAFLGLRGTF